MLNNKVMVAMSGGVDSAVAAYLLREAGYEIIGVNMQFMPPDVLEEGSETGCCGLSAVEDARRVCDVLEIPFYVMNFRNIFKEKIIDYFVAEYLQGKTPNPCIACNQAVKFDVLLKKAMGLGFDYIATGHYAALYYDKSLNRYMMRKAKDLKKDQTYVLYGLTQAQMEKTLMPLADYTKQEIRSIAKEIGLIVAEKPESQDICFIPDNDYRSFISRNINQKIEEGPFLDIEGREIGTHRGIPFYTIGQRKKLGVNCGYPVYVVGIIPEKNAVILGREEDTFSEGLLSEKNNFILFDKLKEPLKVFVKIRYNAEAIQATIIPVDDMVSVKFEQPAKAVTPGQAVVFYDNDLVVGGGICHSADNHMHLYKTKHFGDQS